MGLITRKPTMVCLYQFGDGPRKLCQNACVEVSLIGNIALLLNIWNGHLRRASCPRIDRDPCILGESLEIGTALVVARGFGYNAPR